MNPARTNPLDVVILALEAHGSRVRPRGNTGASAQCPSHDDNDPSLSVNLGDCGLCVVLKCHGHCDTAAVLDALALSYPDLRHPDCGVHRSSQQPGHPAPAARTRTQPHTRTRPPAEHGARHTAPQQQANAPADWPNLGRPDATFTYCKVDGTIVGEIRKYEYWCDGARVRKTFRPFRIMPNGRMRIGKWDEPVLYRLPEVHAAATAADTIYVCEGEPDADAMSAHGVVATTSPFGAAAEWLPEYTEQLRGAGQVVIVRDKDEAGHARAESLHKTLTSAGFEAWIAEAAEGKDPRDHFAAGRTLDDLVPVVQPQSQQVQAESSSARVEPVFYGDGWEAPVSLDAKRMPTFPVHLLGQLAPMAEAVAEAYQVPVDLPAFSALATVATTVGGRRLVFPRPDWKEASPLWTLSALPSGDRKSPAMDAVTAPLTEMERELAADKGPQVDALKQEHRILADRMAEAERAAARKSTAADRAAAKADAEALRQEIAELGHPPELPQLVGGDCTPESLGLHLAEQHGRIGIHTSEAGLFGTFAGRYSNKIPNLDLALEGYRGGPYRLKRVTRAAIDLPAMNLTLNMCIQPGILQGLAAQRENNFRETGFLARFLFAIPTSLVGRRNPDPRPIPDHIRFEYHQAVKRLVREIWDTTTPQAMKLHPRAASELMEFTIALEPRLGAYGDLGPLTDWAAKLAGNLVRVATMLTLYQDPGAQIVGEHEMRSALDMAPFLIAHAWRAFDLMGNDVYGRLEPARNIVAWLRKRATDLRADGMDPLSPFTARDTHRALGGRSWVKDGGADAIAGALADLADYGWIRQAESGEDAQRGRGRPGAPVFEVHPLLAEPLERGGVPGDVTDA